MLRVMIADDEERIIKLIQILADWEALQMEVVGTAGNGPDALSLVRALEPDVLITDIRMPGMDGLELIRQAKKIAPALEVIIISGYAQFDYAQTAIQYGVGEYLLKPINKEALNGTLQKMAERGLQRKSSEATLEQMKQSSELGRERLRANLITDLANGRFDAADAAQLERTYCLSSRERCYQVFVLKMDYDIDRFLEQSLSIVRNKARDILSPMLAEHTSDFVLDAHGAALYGAMNLAQGACGVVRSRLRDCLNQLVEMRSLFGPVVFSLALGRVVHSAKALPESFEEAQSVITERLTEGTERLLEGSVAPSGLAEMDLLARYTQEAAHAIDVLNAESADRAAELLMHVAMDVPNVRGRELLALAQGAGVVFVTRLGGEDREGALMDYALRLGQCHQARSLFDALKALQRAELLKVQERRLNQEGQPIRLAKQYIQKHFAEPLTLEAVSAAIGFSPNYFSTLFKKETGEGFTKYLTKLRMEEARGLLRETRLPVAEVCRGVGYEDIKHFTRTFKQETGITPGEFRKLYG